MKRSVSSPLTHQRLLQVLHYEPLTGAFTWRESGRGRFKRVGAPAGTVDRWGYLCIMVDGRGYTAGRLAWFYMTGAWPTHEVDHRDTDKLNNRWTNLRDATRMVNAQNIRRARCDSATGVLGVTARRGKFVATIEAKGHQRYLGTFSTAAEGSSAYLAAKRKLHPGCTL